MTAFGFIKLRDGDTIKVLASDVEDIQRDFDAAVRNGFATFNVSDANTTEYVVPVSEFKFVYVPDGGNRR